MKSGMEWHDSELVAISAASGTEGVILLDAYVHREVDKSGDAVEGGYQRVRITVPSMFFEGLVPELPTDIYHGSLMLNGTEHNKGLVPLPIRFEGEVKLTLTMLDDGRRLLFSGTGMSVEADGDFRFVESVPFDAFDER